jgi:hypothetical protein
MNLVLVVLSIVGVKMKINNKTAKDFLGVIRWYKEKVIDGGLDMGSDLTGMLKRQGAMEILNIIESEILLTYGKKEDVE